MHYDYICLIEKIDNATVQNETIKEIWDISKDKIMNSFAVECDKYNFISYDDLSPW